MNIVTAEHTAAGMILSLRSAAEGGRPSFTRPVAPRGRTMQAAIRGVEPMDFAWADLSRTAGGRLHAAYLWEGVSPSKGGRRGSLTNERREKLLHAGEGKGEVERVVHENLRAVLFAKTM